MAGTPVLEATRVSGPRGTARVHDVSFALSAGQLLHVHGASGSGKTTLLRLLTRLDPLDSGSLRLGAKDADSIPVTEWRRRLSLVFQEPRLFGGTIADNIEWGAKLHGSSVDARSLADDVGLRLPLDRATGGLSGGEAKRVAIARALAVDPDVLLLDEPTASLDEGSRRALRELLFDLAARKNLAVVLVSHVAQDLHALPGDALLLDAGRVVRTASSVDLAHMTEVHQ